MFDTNTLVSGIINADGNPDKTVDLIRADVSGRDFLKPYIGKNDYDTIMEFLKYNIIGARLKKIS